VIIFNKLKLLTSQGSAATYLRCGGKYYEFVVNFIPFPAMKKFEN